MAEKQFAVNIAYKIKMLMCLCWKLYGCTVIRQNKRKRVKPVDVCFISMKCYLTSGNSDGSVYLLG